MSAPFEPVVGFSTSAVAQVQVHPVNVGARGQAWTNVPSELNQVVAISASPTHDLALLADGTVREWEDPPVPSPRVPG